MNITVEDRFAIKVDGMISIMDKLILILEKENEFLEKNKVRNVEKLIDTKIKLINVYTEQYNALSSDTSRFESLSKSRKIEIKEKAVKLKSMMERNELLLNVNINSTRRLIGMIVTDAKKFENQKSGVYSASGVMGHDSQKKTSNLTFNQVL